MLIPPEISDNYHSTAAPAVRGRQKEIACHCWFTASGAVTPLLFKMEDEEGVIRSFDKIHVNFSEKKLYAGTVSYEYDCSLLVNGLTLHVLLQYYPETCKWYLVQCA